MRRKSASGWLKLLVPLAAILVSLWQLEAPRRGLDRLAFEVDGTPATLTRSRGAKGPLVLVAHGFGGSRQMMSSYTLTLARAGFQVVAFDFAGHGRNRHPMRGDVTRIEGATEFLVEEAARVLARARDLAPGVPVAVLGHSMASDIVIRLSRVAPSIEQVVTLSMYSEAITPDAPQSLLIVTGAGEPHLRRAALEVLAMVDATLGAGETARDGAVRRRAVVAPGVEHVGVLHSATALRETLAWLGGEGAQGGVVRTGPWLILLLLGLLGLMPTLAVSLGRTRMAKAPRPLSGVMRLTLPPLVAGLLVAGLMPVLIPGAAGIGAFAVFLFVTGAVQTLILGRDGGGVSLPGVALMLVWGLGLFAVGLDRYGAAFWLTEARLLPFLVLLPAALLFSVADARVWAVHRQPVWQRVPYRLILAVCPLALVASAPETRVMLIMAAPVLVLFWLTFGLAGRWVAERTSARTAGLGLGVLLAWSLAVSLPLYQP